MATSGFDAARVLVTGGAGFIGSELVRQLAANGARVVVVDNLVNGRRENLEEVLSDEVRLEVCDIRDEARVGSLLGAVDIVFHLASLGVRHSIHSPRENHEVNASGTLGLLMLSREARIERFVHVSSSEVYGTAAWVPMTEDHPTVPSTVYGASKLAGESYARALWRTHKLPVVVVRPFNSYGPRSHHEGDSGEVIPKFLLRALAGRSMVIFGDGTQTRDFTFVADTAAGLLAAALAADAVGETVNLGQGAEVSVNELARLVAEVTGKPGAPVEHVEPRPGDVMRLCADTSKAQLMLGFHPRVGLREGLSRLVEWYASTGSSPEQLLEREVVRNWQGSRGRA